MNVINENSMAADQLDENGGRRRKSKGNRRSSILKMAKSPKSALDDIDPNTQNTESKKSRRSSSRRVSFAETCQIKEIPNVAKKNSWPWDDSVQLNNNENDSLALHLDLTSATDESAYRKPAATLAGLSSLLSSPIQDSPPKARFYTEEGPQELENKAVGGSSLDFTTCVDFERPNVSKLEMSINQMDMTENDFGKIVEQEKERQPFQEIHEEPPNTDDFRDERTSSLDFTHCYAPGPSTAGREDDTLDEMDMTRNQTLRNMIHEDNVSPSKIRLQQQLCEIENEVATNPMYTRQADWKNDVGEKTSSLDFTKCYADKVQNDDVTSDQTMELTAPLHSINKAADAQGNNAPSSKPPISRQRQVLQEIPVEKHVVPASQIRKERVGAVNTLSRNMQENVNEEIAQSNKTDGTSFLRKLSGLSSHADDRTMERSGVNQVDLTLGNHGIESSGIHNQNQDVKTSQMDFTMCRGSRGVEPIGQQDQSRNFGINQNEMDLTLGNRVVEASRIHEHSLVTRNSQMNFTMHKGLGQVEQHNQTQNSGSSEIKMGKQGVELSGNYEQTEDTTSDQMDFTIYKGNRQVELPRLVHDKTQLYAGNDEMDFTLHQASCVTESPKQVNQYLGNEQMDFTLHRGNQPPKQDNTSQYAGNDDMDFTLHKANRGTQPHTKQDNQTQYLTNDQMDFTLHRGNQPSKQDNTSQYAGNDDMDFTLHKGNRGTQPHTKQDNQTQYLTNDQMDFTLHRGNQPSKQHEQTQYSGNDEMDFTLHKGNQPSKQHEKIQYSRNDEINFTLHKDNRGMQSPTGEDDRTQYLSNEQMEFTLHKGKQPSKQHEQTQYSGNDEMNFTLHKGSREVESPEVYNQTQYPSNDPMEFTLHRGNQSSKQHEPVQYSTNDEMDFTTFKGNQSTTKPQKHHSSLAPSMQRDKNNGGSDPHGVSYCDIGSRKSNPAHDVTSDVMNMACQVPVDQQQRTHVTDVTSSLRRDDDDVMEMTRCVAEIPKPDERSRVPDQSTVGGFHDGQRTNKDAVGDDGAAWSKTNEANIRSNMMSGGTLSREHHLEDWNIDISRFATKDNPSSYKEESMIVPKAENVGLRSSDAQKLSKSFEQDSFKGQDSPPRIVKDTTTIRIQAEAPPLSRDLVESAVPVAGVDIPIQALEPPTADLESNALKQGNIERKATLSLSTSGAGVSSKRRAFPGDLTTLVPGDMTSVNSPSDDAAGPSLSQTLPILKTSAVLVPKVRGDAVANTSAWAAPGTHEVIHARNSIFGAKGPSIGASRLSLLNRAKQLPGVKNAIFENISLSKPKDTITVSLSTTPDNHNPSDGGESVPPMSLQPQIVQKSPSGNEVPSKSILPLAVPEIREEEPPVTTKGDVASTESKSTTMVHGSSITAITEDMFITDENSGIIMMSDEILDTGVKPLGICEKKEEDLIPVGNETRAETSVVDSSSFEAFRSEIMTPTTKRHLSVICEEGGRTQPIGGKESGENNGGASKNDPVQKKLTLKEFLIMADLNFIRCPNKRSEIPDIQPDIEPSEIKDQIYNCLLAEKYVLLDNFTKEIQADINENERLLAAKEKQFDECNPAIFRELQRAFETQTQDEIIERLATLKRVLHFQASTDWYDRRTALNERILSKLKEQEEILQDDLSMLEERDKKVDDCLAGLDNLSVENNKKIKDLKASLDSEEKEWLAYKKTNEEERVQFEKIESDLKRYEDERGQLVSENEGLSNEIAEEKKKREHLENDIERLEKQANAASSLAEVTKQLKYTQGLQEGILEEHNDSFMKFTYLCRTFDLEIVFEELEGKSQKIKDINLVSCLSDDSIPLAKLGHDLMTEKFSKFNFLEMFPTREHLPQLLHLVSESMARLRLLLESVQFISINHIVSLKDKLLIVEFSSLRKFIKFKVTFDLSHVVTDGAIPYTVTKEIGATSSDVIEKELSNVPSTILCFTKLVHAADKFLG